VPVAVVLEAVLVVLGLVAHQVLEHESVVAGDVVDARVGLAYVQFVDDGVSNRHSSTFSACAENRAKFTPAPPHVAPRGCGSPGQTAVIGRRVALCGPIGRVEDASIS
jgi:hypothetical protein